jgi:putrescine transport system permease protein
VARPRHRHRRAVRLAAAVLPRAVPHRREVLRLRDGRHPGQDLVTYTDGAVKLAVKFANYATVFSDSLYFNAYLASLKYALCTTLACLFIGYPFAYFMARARASVQPLLLMLVMLPFWTSFLLRVYAWKGLLDDGGWVADAIIGLHLDRLLLAMGLIESPGQLMHTTFSLLVGMTYTYLPFMVLPLYANLSKMDLRLLEAASDLGATPWVAFWRVTVPLSFAGIVAGSMLVFIPCVGEYVTPELLGGPQTLMIGRVIWDENFSNNDPPMAATDRRGAGVADRGAARAVQPLPGASRGEAANEANAPSSAPASPEDSAARGSSPASCSCTCRW